MAPCFAAADLYLPVVQRGPFPTTVPEAMAYGRPLVGFAGSGCVEEQICGSVVGVVVPYGDVRC
jgi:glycosyltransferase involved in cell wall biosynthesis